MLRITLAPTTDAQITLRLDGEISGRWVEELRRECAPALNAASRDARRLVLDVAGVSSIDASGLELFRELRARRAVVTNCSPYLAELLKGDLRSNDDSKRRQTSMRTRTNRTRAGSNT